MPCSSSGFLPYCISTGFPAERGAAGGCGVGTGRAQDGHGIIRLRLGAGRICQNYTEVMNVFQMKFEE